MGLIRTWARLNDGSEVILNQDPLAIEEAAENEELIPTLDGKRLVPAVEIQTFTPYTVRTRSDG